MQTGDRRISADQAKIDLEFAKQGLRQQRSLYRDAIYRFSRNKLAILGLVLVIVLVALAVFADDWFIAPFLGRPAKPLIAKAPYDKVFYGPSGAFPGAKYWM